MTNFKCDRCATTYPTSKPSATRSPATYSLNDCPICGAGQDAVR